MPLSRLPPSRVCLSDFSRYTPSPSLLLPPGSSSSSQHNQRSREDLTAKRVPLCARSLETVGVFGPPTQVIACLLTLTVILCGRYSERSKAGTAEGIELRFPAGIVADDTPSNSAYASERKTCTFSKLFVVLGVDPLQYVLNQCDWMIGSVCHPYWFEECVDIITYPLHHEKNRKRREEFYSASNNEPSNIHRYLKDNTNNLYSSIYHMAHLYKVTHYSLSLFGQYGYIYIYIYIYTYIILPTADSGCATRIEIAKPSSCMYS